MEWLGDHSLLYSLIQDSNSVIKIYAILGDFDVY